MINEQLQLLIENEGLIPSEIAERSGIPVASVIDSLRNHVGHGSLRLSDIYFGWRAEKRQLLHRLADDAKKTGTVNGERLRMAGVTVEDLEFLWSIHKRQTFAGDLYDHIAEAEIALHSLVKKTLVEKFGDEEDGYWLEGIPLSIRQQCHARREEDDEPAGDPFKYTTLIELSRVIDSTGLSFSRCYLTNIERTNPRL